MRVHTNSLTIYTINLLMLLNFSILYSKTGVTLPRLWNFDLILGYISLEASTLWRLQTFIFTLLKVVSFFLIPQLAHGPKASSVWPTLSPFCWSTKFQIPFHILLILFLVTLFQHDFSIFQSAWLYSSNFHHLVSSAFSGSHLHLVERERQS